MIFDVVLGLVMMVGGWWMANEQFDRLKSHVDEHWPPPFSQALGFLHGLFWCVVALCMILRGYELVGSIWR